MNKILVCKFGGTSVGDVAKIKNVAKKLIKFKNDGYCVVVVVSAMGKSTDTLIELAEEINPNPLPRDMDMLLSTGEQVSIALLSMAISSFGHEATSLTGGQSGIRTYDEHKNAKIDEIDCARIENELRAGRIAIVAGFQGVNELGDITTLGRGGSDTTAVALASQLKAKRCEIFTDVDGVYSSDPRYVKNAHKLDFISYDAMSEMAKLGAGVIHPRAIEIARAYNIPLIIRNSFNEVSGTTIGEEEMIEKPYVRGVALQQDIARFTIVNVPDTPGIAFKLFKILSDNSVSVDMIVQNQGDDLNNISFTTDLGYSEKVFGLADEFAKTIGAGVEMDKNVAKISVIGTGILGYSDTASRFFEALSSINVNIQMITTSETKISVIIEDKDAKYVTNKIHEVLVETQK